MIIGLEGVSAYMDDIIITGATIKEHKDRLRQFYRRIEKYGFRVRAAKPSLLQLDIQILVIFVYQFVRCPDSVKIQATCQMPSTIDVTKLRKMTLNSIGS
ncbi:hypothetical protein B9Z55_025356 [Caenorhabditis nigoni]|uniref:Reverse transcriptase domain-containing protein n=1 Tax=Caenorhabditis nigoni TaxID=1611254 RepID=A0A2G5SYA9_9PELO|nr:hypothetical protein B9Z55_025356 [Caenorhabditis nigoni]